MGEISAKLFSFLYNVILKNELCSEHVFKVKHTIDKIFHLSCRTYGLILWHHNKQIIVFFSKFSMKKLEF